MSGCHWCHPVGADGVRRPVERRHQRRRAGGDPSLFFLYLATTAGELPCLGIILLRLGPLWLSPQHCGVADRFNSDLFPFRFLPSPCLGLGPDADSLSLRSSSSQVQSTGPPAFCHRFIISHCSIVAFSLVFPRVDRAVIVDSKVGLLLALTENVQMSCDRKVSTL